MGCAPASPRRKRVKENSRTEFTANSTKLPEAVITRFGIILQNIGGPGYRKPSIKEISSPEIEPAVEVESVGEVVIRKKSIENTGENFEISHSLQGLLNDEEKESTEKLVLRVKTDIEELGENETDEFVDVSQRKSTVKLTLEPLAEYVHFPIQDFEEFEENEGRLFRDMWNRKDTEYRAKEEALKLAINLKIQEDKNIESTKLLMGSYQHEARKILDKYK